MNNAWEISTRDYAGEKESIMRRGNVYQLANGYMGYRGTLDEFSSDEAVGITLAGIFDRVGSSWREPVNAPNGGFTQLSVDGTDLSVLTSSMKDHLQSLQFRNALFKRQTTFAVGGKSVRVDAQRFLSASQPHLCVIRYSFCCTADADVVVRTGIDGQIWDLNGPHLPHLAARHAGTVLTLEGRTHELGQPVVIAETIDAAFGEHTQQSQGKRELHVIRLRAKAGLTYSFVKYFAIYTGHDRVAGSLIDAARETVLTARTQGFDACLREHADEWQRRWERSDVRIEGDADAQQALRYSILQLLMVAPVKGSATSIPARALSGQVYKGAIFWDTEMFMLPFFLHTYPEKAVELLRYRIRTLDGARRKARSEGPGYRGAFYAWESQETGDDACTYFNIGDPITGRELRTHFRDKQIHISGDVAIALWAYVKHTADDSLLLEGGAEVILECARFYYSYAHFKKDKGRYEILDVIGPDEYHERVNNNAFTNMVAKETFTIATQLSEYLRSRHPEAYHGLVDKLRIEAELAQFEEAAELLYVPAPDPQSGVIEQFDGYFQLRDATVDELKSKMIHPNEYLGAGQGLAVPTKIIKQADVIMMLHLFRSRFSPEVKKANWEYYEPRTEHGSSLSACAYALVATECGHLDFASKYFLKTAKIDLEAKYKVYVGTVFMGGSHPAANGGAWMTAVLGFGGVQVTEDAVHLNPRLCPGWQSLEFYLTYRGDAFAIRITRDHVSVAPQPQNQQEHVFVVAGRTVRCSPRSSLVIEYRDHGSGAAAEKFQHGTGALPVAVRTSKPSI